MNSYGLPLNFKLTCKNTGRDSFPHELGLDQTPNPLAGAYLYRIEGAGSSNFEADPVIRQSTGFTDAAGKDVYFGDVLVSNEVYYGLVFFNVQSISGGICAISSIDPVNVVMHRDNFKHNHIVGNAYEPPARWLERAREIWPDAELADLAEGVRKEDER